jgi:hypothetical protein
VARAFADDSPATALPFVFEGIDSPNGTIFPDILLDRVMAHLSGAEFKVLAYIVRRTFGFKKDADTISLDQICHGIARRDGSVLDEGTGLTRKTAIVALKGLEDKGVITVHRRCSPTRGSLPSSFALRFRATAPAAAPADDEMDDDGVNDGLGANDGQPVHRTAPGSAAGTARASGGGEKGNPQGDRIHTPRVEHRHSGGVIETRGRGANRYPQQTEEQQTEQTTPVVAGQGTGAEIEGTERQDAALGAEQAALLALLLAEGVSASRAVQLCTRYPAAAIKRQVEWLEGRRYDDRAACLVAAIEHDYGAPVPSGQRAGADRSGRPFSSRRRGAPEGPAVSGPDRYSRGRYGVCPACGCSPCDISCPTPRDE